MKKQLLLIFAVLAAFLSAGAQNTITYTATSKLSLNSYNFTPNFTSHTYDEDTQTGTLTFPSDVTKVGNWAFMSQTALLSVDIPNSVTELGIRAFDGCTGVTSINLSDNIKEIGDWTFYKTTNLTSITLPASLESIGVRAFSNSGITSLEIPNSVTTIDDSAFRECSKLASVILGNSVQTIGSTVFYSDSKLKKLTSLNPIPPTVESDTFKSVPSACYLYVPVEGYMDYKVDDQWKSFFFRNALPGTLALNDEKEYTIDKNVTDCTLSYTRTVTTDDWMGLYLPFQIDVTAVEGTYAMLTDVSANGILEWTAVEEGTISAGTPFIYKPESAGEIVFTSSDGILHKNSDVHPIKVGYDDVYTLAGTYLKKTNMQGIYGLAKGNFYIGGTSAKPLKPYRIFLTAPASVSQTNAPILMHINGEDTATDIEGLTIDSLPIDNCMYNLQGVRVNNNYRGFVIVNGKKLIIK